MLNQFYKYQSIGNDFILFDCYYKEPDILKEIINSKKWKPFVKKICKQKFNIGADGVLILKKTTPEKSSNGQPIKQIPELLIYNADGSQAEICLNGIRCASRHLKEYHDINNSFKFKIGDKVVDCIISKENITTKISNIIHEGSKTIKLNVYTKKGPAEMTMVGNVINVGNPHFIINKKVTKEWLFKNGTKIESNKEFDKKTNVEFIWQKNNENQTVSTNLNVLVYERGVGPTLSCSSGATAIAWLLYQQKKIKPTQRVNLFFDGGTITCWIDKNKFVNLLAKAELVFKGSIL